MSRRSDRRFTIDTEVRLASRTDAAACAELAEAALGALDESRGGPLVARRELSVVARALLRPGGLDRLIADRGRHVLVGLLDGTRVALAIGKQERLGAATLGIVEWYYVMPEARGVGVGEAMIRALLGWFEETGCSGVDANALPGDRLSKSFFEAHGFKARLVTMHRSFERGDG